MGDWEFQTQIGVHQGEAEGLLKGIADALGNGGGIV